MTVPTNNEDARAIVVNVLADLDYNDGGMMRWYPSGEPTKQAETVASRIMRELAPFLAARRLPVSGDNAEAGWRKAIADHVRRNCTPSREAYSKGGDFLNSPTLAVHAEAARFGYVLSSMEAAYIAEAAIAASGLREEPREAAPTDTDREALAALRDLFNAGRGQWHSDSCRADFDAAMQALSDDRGRFDASRFSRTSHTVQVEPAPSDVDGVLAMLDDLNASGGIAYDDYSRLHDAVALLAPAEPVQVEVSEEMEGRAAFALAAAESGRLGGAVVAVRWEHRDDAHAALVAALGGEQDERDDPANWPDGAPWLPVTPSTPNQQGAEQ